MGDLRIVQKFHAMVTTVRLNFEAMANKALDILLKQIDGS